MPDAGGTREGAGWGAPRRRRLSRAVRQRMGALGINQKELAARAGLSKSGVGRLLAGEREPRMVTLERVAAALGVHPSALLEDDPEAAAGAPPAETAPSLEARLERMEARLERIERALARLEWLGRS